jgi:hypothetical protein
MEEGMPKRELKKPRPNWAEEHERKNLLPENIRCIGRPSLYLQEYSEEIIRFCSDGYSIGAFAATKGVSRPTLYQWASDHPEFLTALKVAQGMQQLKHEQRLVSHGGDRTATGPMVNATIYALKNSHSPDWSEHLDEQQQAQPQEQHRHVHIHAGMDAVSASEAYQRLLKEL